MHENMDGQKRLIWYSWEHWLAPEKESLPEIKAPWQVTYWEDLANHHLNQVSLHLVIAMLKAKSRP